MQATRLYDQQDCVKALSHANSSSFITSSSLTLTLCVIMQISLKKKNVLPKSVF